MIAVAVGAALVALALIFGLHIGGGNNPPQPAASPPSQIVDATISQDGIQLDRDVVPAGLVRIEVRNLGLTAHSMLVGRVSHGITGIRPYPGPGPEQAALSLAPGEADVLAVRLSQGAYVLYQLEPGGSRVEDLTVTP